MLGGCWLRAAMSVAVDARYVAKVWRNTSKLVKSWKSKMQREEKEGLPKK